MTTSDAAFGSLLELLNPLAVEGVEGAEVADSKTILAWAEPGRSGDRSSGRNIGRPVGAVATRS